MSRNSPTDGGVGISSGSDSVCGPLDENRVSDDAISGGILTTSVDETISPSRKLYRDSREVVSISGSDQGRKSENV